jgi:hypothetical protein
VHLTDPSARARNATSAVFSSIVPSGRFAAIRGGELIVAADDVKRLVRTIDIEPVRSLGAQKIDKVQRALHLGVASVLANAGVREQRADF